MSYTCDFCNKEITYTDKCFTGENGSHICPRCILAYNEMIELDAYSDLRSLAELKRFYNHNPRHYNAETRKLIPYKGRLGNSENLSPYLPENYHFNPANPLDTIDTSWQFQDIFDEEEIQQLFYNKKPTKRVKKAEYVQKYTPVEMVEYLDKYVVGQEEAKVQLAMAVYNHNKRIAFDDMKKSNILMSGPTGCGKTYMVKKLSELLNVPFTVIDATSLTEAGYVGNDVDTILTNLYLASDSDINKAEFGIVMIDEIDKLAATGESADVSGEGVQQDLLKIIEGSELYVSTSFEPNSSKIKMDTSKILFICAGTFAKAETWENDEDDSNPYRDDSVDYPGIIPELLGRLTVHIKLKHLTAKDLSDIFWKYILPESHRLYQLDKIRFGLYNEETFNEIGQIAFQFGTGARGLRNFCEQLFNNIFYDLMKYEADGMGTRYSIIVIHKETLYDYNYYTINTDRKVVKRNHAPQDLYNVLFPGWNKKKDSSGGNDQDGES